MTIIELPDTEIPPKYMPDGRTFKEALAEFLATAGIERYRILENVDPDTHIPLPY